MTVTIPTALPKFLQRNLSAPWASLVLRDSAGPTAVEYGLATFTGSTWAPFVSYTTTTVAGGDKLAPLYFPVPATSDPNGYWPYVKDLSTGIVEHAPSTSFSCITLLWIEQSNGYNLSALPDPNAPTSDPLTRVWVAGASAPAVPIGADITLLNRLRARHGVPILLLNASRPSIGLTYQPGVGDWWLNTYGSSRTLLAALLAAAGGRVEAKIYGPGEADAINGCPRPVYHHGMHLFDKCVDDQLDLTDRPASAIPRFIIELGDLRPVNADPSYVRDAQHDFIRSKPNTYLGCKTYNLLLDGTIHRTVGSLVLEANDVASAILRFGGYTN